MVQDVIKVNNIKMKFMNQNDIKLIKFIIYVIVIKNAFKRKRII